MIWINIKQQNMYEEFVVIAVVFLSTNNTNLNVLYQHIVLYIKFTKIKGISFEKKLTSKIL